MAFTNKRKRVSRRPPPRTRRRTNRRMRLRVPRPLIVPSSQTVHLRWTQVNFFNPGAGTAATQVYRANSLFDPDVTGVGDQPPGFDQWGQFYSVYTVVSSKIKLELVPSLGNVAVSPGDRKIMVNIASKQNTDFYTSQGMVHARAFARVKSVLMNSGGFGSKSGTRTIFNNFNLRRDFGHGRQSDTESATDTNPVEQWYYVCQATNPFSTVDPIRLDFVCTIDYIVRFTNRKNTMFDT